jgi:hypothetical protein
MRAAQQKNIQKEWKKAREYKLLCPLRIATLA